MKEAILSLIGKDIYQSKEIYPYDIPFAEYVADYCKMNSCGKYNKSWTCPPGVGSFLEFKEKYLQYNKALVINMVCQLEDCFDIDGMDDGCKKIGILGYKVIKEMKKTGRDVALLKAGSCDLCKECTYPSAPCRHKEWAFPTLEACGIDVMALAKKFDMTYYAGQNTVTYFMIFFYN